MYRKLLGLLKRNKISYKEIEHKTVYTAFDLAKTTGIDLKEIAKTLLIKADGQFVLVVLPGHRNLDLTAFKKFLNHYYKSNLKKNKQKFSAIKTIKICTETQIKRNLTRGQTINLLPFGWLYGKDLFVDYLEIKKLLFQPGLLKEPYV